MTWKKVECPFEKDRKILQYLLTAPAFTEDGKFHQSEAVEGFNSLEVSFSVWCESLFYCVLALALYEIYW